MKPTQTLNGSASKETTFSTNGKKINVIVGTVTVPNSIKNIPFY